MCFLFGAEGAEKNILMAQTLENCPKTHFMKEFRCIQEEKDEKQSLQPAAGANKIDRPKELEKNRNVFFRPGIFFEIFDCCILY